MTTAGGTLISCGPSQGFSLQFTCTGPSCPDVTGFPGLICTTDTATGTSTCSNGVVCPGSTNYTSQFTFSQSNLLVSQTQKIILADFCEEIDLVSDGTTGGTDTTKVALGACGPGISSSTTRASTSTRTKSHGTAPASGIHPTSMHNGTYSAPHYSHTHAPQYTKGHHTDQQGNSEGHYYTDGYYHNPGAAEYADTTTLVPGGYPAATETCTTSTENYGDLQPTAGPYPHEVNPVSGHVESASTSGSPSYLNSSDINSVYATGSNNIFINSPISTGYAASTQYYSSSAASSRHSPGPALWVVFLLLLSGLVQGTFALASPMDVGLDIAEREVPSESPHVMETSLSLEQRKLTPGWKTFSDLFSEYYAGKLQSPEFADNLAHELADAICSHAVGVAVTEALGVDLVEVCVASIYAGNAVVAPELEFLSVFYASVICNLLVAEALPGIDALTKAICDEPKPCTENFLTDPNNCGTCGNKCSTGVCANGACTSNTCTGQTCATFGPCGPGGSCVCTSTSEGTGYCADGSTSCAGLATCVDSSNCGSGEICAVGTCCGNNVCVGATFCGDTSPVAVAKAMLARSWENATIASLGVWVN